MTRKIPILLLEVGNFVRNVTHDISQYIPSMESFKSNLLSSARNIGSRIVRGGGKTYKNEEEEEKSLWNET